MKLILTKDADGDIVVNGEATNLDMLDCLTAIAEVYMVAMVKHEKHRDVDAFVKKNLWKMSGALSDGVSNAIEKCDLL